MTDKTPSKVLFLDIDGVCNHAGSSHSGLFPIDPVAAARVARIVAYTNCEVVLSSTWRRLPDGRKIISEKVVPIYDITGDDGKIRGDEIKAWLDAHPDVTQYAILDDDKDFHPDQHLFQTDWEHGLTEEIMENVISHLGAEK